MPAPEKYNPLQVETPKWQSMGLPGAQTRRQKTVTQVTPESFPTLCNLNPDIRTNWQKKQLYTYKHSILPYNLAELLTLPWQSMDVNDLVFKQHATLYPSEAIKEIDLHAAQKRSGYSFVYTDEEGNKFSGKNNYTRSKFTDAELIPDRRYPASSLEVDPTVNALLALRLLLPQGQETFNNPTELSEHANKAGLTVNLTALHEGFIQVVAKPNVELLINSGVLQPDSLQPQFADAADWLLMLTEARSLGKGKRGWPIPYESSAASERQPHIDFLPELGRITLDYLALIPELIAEGREYNPEILKSCIQSVYRTTNQTLAIATEQGVDQTRIQEVVREMKDLQPDFTKLWDLYRSQPDLLNRLTKYKASRGFIPSYHNIRTQILAAGGRGPRRPLWYKSRYGLDGGRTSDFHSSK